MKMDCNFMTKRKLVKNKTLSQGTGSTLSFISHRNERRAIMKKYMLLYKGPATSANASHEKWPAWFNKLGDQLVSAGSPMDNGLVLYRDGSKGDSATNLNGYSIIQARNINSVKSLVKDHPYLAQGSDDYSIEIFELAR
jgi:hypothetical protein